MAKVIYFDAEPTKKSVIRFVEDYRKGGWFRKEKIEYSIEGGYLPVIENVEGAYDRIKRDFPDAIIYSGTTVDVDKRLENNRVWVIAKHTDKGFSVFYSHITAGRVEWTSDICNAELNFDCQSADGVADELRRTTGEKIIVMPVCMNFKNPLLDKNFILLCRSRKSGVTKYFARHEQGNRIRLVKNSDSAARFTYAEVIDKFESLKATNKAFFYTVCNAFSENVNYKQIEDYEKSGKVAKAVAVTDKLKWMNR